MYIYRTFDGGTPAASAEQARLRDDFRVIEVDGKPSSVVGIRFSPSAEGAQDEKVHAEQPADPYSYDSEGNPQYWPDRPDAARLAWREEFKASCHSLQSASTVSAVTGHLSCCRQAKLASDA